MNEGCRLMTSPRKLNLVPEDANQLGKTVLNCLESVIAWTLQESAMIEYHPTVAEEDNDALFLSKDGFIKILLGPEVYTRPDRLAHYLETHANTSTVFVCAGTDEQLNELPIECIKHNVQQLGLPSMTTNLRACVASVHSFQLSMANSKAERDVLEEATENVKYIMGISRVLRRIISRRRAAAGMEITG